MNDNFGLLSMKFAIEHANLRVREAERRETEWKLFGVIMAAGMTFFFLAFVVVVTGVK